MKKHQLLYTLTIFYITLNGCIGGGISFSDDLTSIPDSLGYEKILGTYVFKPNAEQAKILLIDTNDVITLKIAKDSLIKFGSGNYQGKYNIDKMVFMINPYPKEQYSSTWTYMFGHQSRVNSLYFKQPIGTNNDISFEIQKAIDSDTLHIIGYVNHPKYEIFRLLDFKKVK